MVKWEMGMNNNRSPIRVLISFSAEIWFLSNHIVPQVPEISVTGFPMPFYHYLQHLHTHGAHKNRLECVHIHK